MLRLRPFEDISGFDAGWLKARHHFAFGPYGNPDHKAVGNLIVLNDDEIAPHTGFGLHPHENVEIVSYLREGTVTPRRPGKHWKNARWRCPSDERRNRYPSLREE